MGVSFIKERIFVHGFHYFRMLRFRDGDAGNVGLRFITDIIYQNTYIVWWFILSVLLFAGTAHEIYLAIKQTEEYTWNLSLTD